MPPLYTYLTMMIGPQAGMNFLLNEAREFRIGRGEECTITLLDPICSRVHAVLFCRDRTWRVRDAGSRNGTFVNDQKVDEAVLAEGHSVRIGACEFAFHQTEQPPTAGSVVSEKGKETIVRDTVMGSFLGEELALSAIQDSEQAQDLLLLYQLSIKLLGCADPQEVIRESLDLLRTRTNATIVGFLWVSDDGHLKPKLMIPESAAKQVSLSESLTRLVSDEGHAVWTANQRSAGEDERPQDFADAFCVPLVQTGTVLGAMHVYLDHGRFRQSEFEFAISVANITAVALARARHEKSLTSDLARLKAASPGYDDLVGASPGMRDLKSKLCRMARASGCVLVRGESGTGKELVARAIHRASPRADRPMLTVNCAAIPADIMESQLFGHKAGSFTGAASDHAGYFRQADLGTLFLDEIGELTLAGQSKLLRILEGHPFLPVGSSQEVSVDVRVIAATNRDLLSYVREKKFREDLYYRLSVFEVVIPPLRERGGDISLLIDFFLEHFCAQHGRPGLELSSGARAKLLAYQWPGNVRQLRNVIDSAVVLAMGKAIDEQDLGLQDAGTTGELDSLRMDVWEQRLIVEALKRTAGNVPEAAKLLGVGRATIYRKIEEYGIVRR
ncbi:MAG TPA: sigma 54-interacting transcriptional regulator [Pirellulales bacterium]|jgi:Nif-specific regulatory protein